MCLLWSANFGAPHTSVVTTKWYKTENILAVIDLFFYEVDWFQNYMDLIEFKVSWDYIVCESDEIWCLGIS